MLIPRLLVNEEFRLLFISSNVVIPVTAEKLPAMEFVEIKKKKGQQAPVF
jgi:hypothetical protein